jgi:hypothetical protein
MDMTNPIVNRNDDQYSSDMAQIETLPLVTSGIAPAHWRHSDDDTHCETPVMCESMGRPVHVRGGRPDEGQWAEREGWSGATLAE